MAYYHAYRPQSFKEIYETQQGVAELLVASLLKQNINHAYLFTGSHGIGKTSCARILAKAVNCEKYATLTTPKNSTVSEKVITTFPVPCNECSACTSITNGTAVDVVEMDAASNRSIDDIRELRERIRLMPASLPKKVYIIDEVHMLTTEAFNALLKTLEEPPAHALFILCTTDNEKVPLTIRSRCTSILFMRPTVEIIKKYIQRMATSEKLDIDDSAATFLSRLSGGAFRDAAKYLEMAALNGTAITQELVQKQFVGGDSNTTERILEAIASSNLEHVLKEISVLESMHVHFSELVRDILNHLHNLILYKSNVLQQKDLPVYSTFNAERFCAERDISVLSEYVETFLKALGQQKSTPIPSMPLELACIKILAPQPVQRTMPTPSSSREQVPSPTPAPTIKKPVKSVTAPTVDVDAALIETIAQVDQPVAVIEDNSDDNLLESADGPVTLDVVQTRWTEVVKLVKRYNASMAMLMSKCKPIKLDGKIVTVETNYSFHKDMMESPKNRPVIEQAIYELLGAQLRVKGTLAKSRLTPKQVENVREVATEDLVAAVQEIFGA